jgi:hypothetical protein
MSQNTTSLAWSWWYLPWHSCSQNNSHYHNYKCCIFKCHVKTSLNIVPFSCKYILWMYHIIRWDPCYKHNTMGVGSNLLWIKSMYTVQLFLLWVQYLT